MRAVEVGFDVVGLDLDTRKVEQLVEGSSFVEDISDSTLQNALASGRYQPTANPATSAGFDFAIITVPTPLRETLPDLSFIESAAHDLSVHLTKGCTVVLESTTYPGTTESLMVPILEQGSGLTAGVDFFVGYSPERIDPGNTQYGFVNTPKVVAGIDDASSEVICNLYGRLVDTVVPVSTPKEAELTKLLEN
ncbi:nucleotide sugar dehydrogenase, partial [Nocardioides sp.]|uniref:nucleotide sugar dehydrogenase n=1 Tax=Nocardioides sp. TaxID=35761 RepID=UPI00356910C6